MSLGIEFRGVRWPLLQVFKCVVDSTMLNMRDISTAILLAGGLTLSGGGVSAQAGSITFDFGSLANGASDAQIQSLMNSSLPAGDSVTVTGAVASNSYNADGHVVGPLVNGFYTSYTLADLDPSGHGTFIQNNSEGSPASNEITMTFTGLTISGVSFDFEIFPDDTCPSLSNCGGQGNPNLPDLTLVANGSHQVIQYGGVVPGQPGSYNTSYTHSPASGQFSNELAPQLLGSSGTLSLPAGTTELEFQDWPATIAINNLVISPPGNSVPEPGTMTLLASGLICLGLVRRRRTCSRRRSRAPADAPLSPTNPGATSRPSWTSWTL
jgi:PEP-CTERM motif